MAEARALNFFYKGILY